MKRIALRRTGNKGSKFIKVFTLLCSVLFFSCNTSNNDTESSQSNNSNLDFTEVTEEAGINDYILSTGAFGEKWFPESLGAGCAFIDYNNDDWPDILLVSSGNWSRYRETDEDSQILWLYRNNQDGTFTQVTEQAELLGLDTYAHGVTVADYNNDGYDDFFLATLYRNYLFRNDNGKFTEVGAEAGLADLSEMTTTAMFFDADKDGWLDLYVGNYIKWSPDIDIFCSGDGVTKAYCRPDIYEGIPGRFYHNNMDGTFSDYTQQAGFLLPPDRAPGNALSIVQFDYNKDGWLDIAISNDSERNLLYENDGDGTFTERGLRSGIALDETGNARSSMGMDVGDVDNNGEQYIFIGTFAGEMLGAFHNMNEGLFMDQAAQLKVGRPTYRYVNMGLFLFDVDLDTDLDLYICNGHIHENISTLDEGITYLEPSQLFINQPDETFQDIVPQIGGDIAEPIAGRGSAYADYDRDGDLDILVTDSDRPAKLWRNELIGKNSIRIHLVGRETNRDGIGSQIKVVVGDTTINRWVRTGASYLSQSEYIPTIGLDDYQNIDTLQVHWLNGLTQQFTNVAVNQEIQVTEGQNEIVRMRTLRN